MSNPKDKRKKKKKQQSFLEKQLYQILRKSLKTTIDMALDDILKELK